MQPFKLVPSLTARIPGRSASPLRLKPLKPSQPMGTSRNRETEPGEPSDGPDLWVTTAVFKLMLLRIWSYLSLMVTLMVTFGPVPKAIMNSNREDDIQAIYWKSTKLDVHIERAPSSMLLELVFKLPPIFHSRGAHVPSLTLPPFTCAGVSSQRGFLGTWHCGTGSGTGNWAPKKPQEHENSEVSKSKKRKEIEGVQKSAAEKSQGMHGFWWRPGAMGASVARWWRSSASSKPENLASVPSAGYAGTGTAWLRSKSGNKWCSDANQASIGKFYQ